MMDDDLQGITWIVLGVLTALLCAFVAGRILAEYLSQIAVLA